MIWLHKFMEFLVVFFSNQGEEYCSMSFAPSTAFVAFHLTSSWTKTTAALHRIKIPSMFESGFMNFRR